MEAEKTDVSDFLRNYLYESSCRKINTQFFSDFFYLSFLRSFFFKKEKKRNHQFLKSEKIYMNLIKYSNIFEPY